jgi:hypothetical protein
VGKNKEQQAMMASLMLGAYENIAHPQTASLRATVLARLSA